jgi:hypothetical protein
MDSLVTKSQHYICNFTFALPSSLEPKAIYQAQKIQAMRVETETRTTTRGVKYTIFHIQTLPDHGMIVDQITDLVCTVTMPT